MMLEITLKTGIVKKCVELKFGRTTAIMYNKNKSFICHIHIKDITKIKVVK